MNTKVSFLSRSKLLLLGSALFLSSMFFGQQASAVVCTWTASTSQAASTLTNWESASGGACATLTGNLLMFDGTRTSTNAQFDTTTSTSGILTNGSYTGTVNINTAITVSTTGDVSAGGGTFQVGGTLDVSGNLSVSTTAFNATGTINLAGNLIATSTFNQTAGLLNLTGTSKNIFASSTLTFNDIDISGSITLNKNATTTGNVTTTGSGQLDIVSNNLAVGGNLSANGGYINASGGTVTMTGTSKTLGGTASTTLYNVTVNGTITLAGNVTSTNVLTINSAKSLAGGEKRLTLSGTGTPLVVNGIFTANTSTVIYSGATSSVASTTYYNLTLSGATSDTITGSTTVNNLFTVNTPLILEPGTDNLTLTATGTPFVNNTAASLFGNLLIRYTGNGVNITSGTFYAVTIDSASSSVYGPGLVPTSNFTINSGAVFNARTSTIEVQGGTNAFVNNGTFNSGSSTFTYSNAATANIVSTTYYNLVINSGSTATLTNSTTVSNVLTINASKTLDASSYTLTLSGSGTPFVNNGTFTASTSVVNYTGTSNVASNTIYYVLKGSGTQTLVGDVTTTLRLFVPTGGAFTQTSGNFTVNGSDGEILASAGNTTLANVYAVNTTTLSGTITSTMLTVSAAKTFIIGTTNGLILTGTGTPLVLGTGSTFTANSSTVTYSGATANIASTTYYNLTVNNGTSGTLMGSTTVSNVLTINASKTLDSGSGTVLTLSGTGTPFVKNGTFTSNSNTQVTYSGSTFNVATTSYANLVFQGAATIAGDVTVTQVFMVDTGYSSNQSSGTFTMNGSGTFINGAGDKTFYNLTLATTTLSAGSSVTTTNVLTVNSNATFSPGTGSVVLSGTGTPLVVNGTFTAGSSTVTYSGATANLASTTYYNLTVNNGTAGTLMGSTTVSNVLTINASKTLAASTQTLTLSGTGTPLVVNGTFTAGSSTVRYTSSGSVTPTAVTYWNTTLGSGTYTLAGNTTSTNSFTNAGTLTIGSSKTLYAPGTYTNTGTVTETGAIVHPAASFDFIDGAGTAATTYGTAANSVYLKVVDTDANLTTSADTITVTLTSDTYSDTETITLTETGGATGIFQSSGNIFSVASAKTNGDGLIQVSGNGTVSLAYTDSKDATDTGSDTATYTGNTFAASSGSSGGGGVAGGGAGTAPSKVTVGLPGAPSSVSSQVVTVNLSATNAKDMVISEDPGFAGASWEAFAASKVVTLSPGNGKKTLYIKFRSASGASTAVYKVEVVLNTVASVSVPPASQPAKEPVKESASAGVSGFNAKTDSKVVILPVKKLEYVPNSSVAYTYKFKNETNSTLKVKVLRQVLDSKGKVVSKINGSASIAKGKTFTSKANSALTSKLADGKYTIQVKLMDSKNKVLAENSFDVMVKKPAPVVKKPAVKAPAKKQ